MAAYLVTVIADNLPDKKWVVHTETTQLAIQWVASISGLQVQFVDTHLSECNGWSISAYPYDGLEPAEEQMLQESGDYNTCLDGENFSEKLADIILNMLPHNARSALSLAELLTEEYGGMPYSKKLADALDHAREVVYRD